VAYDSNQMGRTRRIALLTLMGSAILSASSQDIQEQNPNRRLPPLPNPDEEPKLPNGKSQKDAIAKQQHEEALKDASRLVVMAQELRDELQHAGDYVVPIATMKKTEEIEKLARRIRGRLKE
jgi:hypothetical protein